mmetsp:Transcript_27813/g.43422  ORF Transcript_27813/g.43422 Transcript_27813/m.43422 type:complete len:492 (+) Transcript_27813:76-1551(+)
MPQNGGPSNTEPVAAEALIQDEIVGSKVAGGTSSGKEGSGHRVSPLKPTSGPEKDAHSHAEGHMTSQMSSLASQLGDKGEHEQLEDLVGRLQREILKLKAQHAKDIQKLNRDHAESRQRAFASFTLKNNELTRANSELKREKRKAEENYRNVLHQIQLQTTMIKASQADLPKSSHSNIVSAMDVIEERKGDDPCERPVKARRRSSIMAPGQDEDCARASPSPKQLNWTSSTTVDSKASAQTKAVFGQEEHSSRGVAKENVNPAPEKSQSQSSSSSIVFKKSNVKPPVTRPSSKGTPCTPITETDKETSKNTWDANASEEPQLDLHFVSTSTKVLQNTELAADGFSQVPESELEVPKLLPRQETIGAAIKQGNAADASDNVECSVKDENIIEPARGSRDEDVTESSDEDDTITEGSEMEAEVEHAERSRRRVSMHKSYAEPALNRKLRQGDPNTFNSGYDTGIKTMTLAEKEASRKRRRSSVLPPQLVDQDL